MYMYSVIALECQLVSLAKDRTLHLWPLEEQLKQDLETDIKSESYVNIDTPTSSIKPTTVPSNIDEVETSFGPLPAGSDLTNPVVGSPGSVSGSPSTSSVSIPAAMVSSSPSIFQSPSSHTLAQEFALLSLELSNLEMEKVRVGERREGERGIYCTLNNV